MGLQPPCSVLFLAVISAFRSPTQKPPSTGHRPTTESILVGAHILDFSPQLPDPVCAQHVVDLRSPHTKQSFGICLAPGRGPFVYHSSTGIASSDLELANRGFAREHSNDDGILRHKDVNSRAYPFHPVSQTVARAIVVCGGSLFMLFDI